MVMLVVIINTLISLICLYVAWQLWKIRRVLADAADAIIAADRSTYALLHGAPEAISQGQIGTKGLRSRYQLFGTQSQQVGQILSLLGLGGQLYRRQLRIVQQAKFMKKTLSKSL